LQKSQRLQETQFGFTSSAVFMKAWRYLRFEQTNLVNRPEGSGNTFWRRHSKPRNDNAKKIEMNSRAVPTEKY